jgi:hypothetical protein
MKRLTSAVVLTSMFAFGFHAATAAASEPTQAQNRNRNQDQLRSQMTDRQIQVILTRIRTNAESLLRTIDGAPPRGRAQGNRARQSGDVAYLVEDLVQASQHLSDHVRRREATRTDMDDLLSRAHAADAALTRTPAPRAGQTAWTNIRRDIDRLAQAYTVNWDWQNPQYPGTPGAGVYQRLTGTYQLDQARSDDPQRVIDAALRSVSSNTRARTRRQLISSLEPPTDLAIDRNDRRVTISSSLGPQVTFDADGQARTDPGGVDRALSTRATLYGDQLVITTTGASNMDYTMTIEPLSDGRDLQITRRIYNDALAQPVTLRTVYRRTADTADWTINDRTPNRTSEYGNLVPDGVTLVARLEKAVNLQTARDDDPITLTVRNASRPELDGATIEGYVRTTQSDTNRGIVIRFDQIRLRNGQYADFDGVIEKMVGPSGQAIRYDGEQSTAGDGRTRQAVERGAIGAAVGAIMGAILGGGKGAAIGAVVGGGGAAATVLIGGDSGQTQLMRGTEFTIRTRVR